MADLTMPNFAAALPAPRADLPNEARSNVGLALASGLLNTISGIANTYMEARKTKEQANALGDALIESGEPTLVQQGNMYKRMAETMPVNYFAGSSTSSGSGSVAKLNSGILDDAIQALRDANQFKQRKELMNLEFGNRSALNQQDLVNDLVKNAAEETASRNIINQQIEGYDRNAANEHQRTMIEKGAEANSRQNLLEKEAELKDQEQVNKNLDEVTSSLINGLNSGKIRVKSDDAGKKIAEVLGDPGSYSSSDILGAIINGIEKAPSDITYGGGSSSSGASASKAQNAANAAQGYLKRAQGQKP